MTDGEKKAIEYVKEFIEELQCDINMFGFEDDCEEEQNLLVGQRDNFKIILNLIQKQQAELEKYKYLYQKALDNTIKVDKENIQKDKIIERIYDFIWENDCCRYFSKKHTMCNQVLNFDSCLGNCKRHCINKYFEKKVEEKND